MIEGGISWSGVAWRLGATLLLVVLNGFFVAAEFGLVKVRRARIVQLADQGSKTALVARNILDNLDRYLSACQLGITMASLALGALGEPAVAVLLVALLDALGVEFDPTDAVIRWTAFFVAFTTITVLHMTLGEQAPKMWALRRAKSAALASAVPLRLFTIVFWPFIALINSISNAMLRAVGIDADHAHEQVPTRRELRSALALSADAGHISAQARDIADNVFRAIDMQVRHILVPRGDVVILKLSDTRADNLDILRRSGHSRLPLCDMDLDGIVGFVHTKDAFATPLEEREDFDLAELARSPVFVPEITSLGDFMSMMRRESVHVAVVVDEHGSAVGLAFLEDAIEEVVGPIADEFDEPTTHVVETRPGVFEMSGATALPEAADRLDLDLEHASESTIGGYVMQLLGRLPVKGDRVTVGDYEATVIDVTGRRVAGRLRFVHKVKSMRPPPEAPDDAADGAS